MAHHSKFSRAGVVPVLCAAMLFAAPLNAAEPVSVRDAWIRAPVAGQPVVAAYLEMKSPRDAALIGAGSPAAARVEIHTMAMDGGVMKMRPVPRIELPAGKPVKLAPGGLHLMLFGVKQALVPGARVPLALSVEDAGGGRATIEVEAEVRAGTPAMHHKH